MERKEAGIRLKSGKSTIFKQSVEKLIKLIDHFNLEVVLVNKLVSG